MIGRKVAELVDRAIDQKKKEERWWALGPLILLLPFQAKKKKKKVEVEVEEEVEEEGGVEKGFGKIDDDNMKTSSRSSSSQPPSFGERPKP